MVVNFRARGISRGMHKLTRTPTLIIIKKNDGSFRTVLAILRTAATLGSLLLNLDFISFEQQIYSQINLFILRCTDSPKHTHSTQLSISKAIYRLEINTSSTKIKKEKSEYEYIIYRYPIM
jgi:hypothetical protein